MSVLTSFAEVEAALAALAPDKKDPGIRFPERMARLMDFLGNPQDSYRVIHVAGTSGKTSTAYYAAALLQQAGKRVGLTISPHVDAINERMQINLQPLPETEFCSEFGDFLELVRPSGIQPAYFEACTAFAFWEFARRKVDYAVVEVGVGGLADSTNVMQRPDKVCVITDIGYGHMQRLGDTLPEIATHKAGIIQAHNSVFCREQSDEIMQPVRTRAREQQAELHEVVAVADFPFLPTFQRRNFALAKAAAAFVLQRDDPADAKLTPEAAALAAHTRIPARMEIRHLGTQTLVLDAAHNPQKLAALIGSLRAQFPDQNIAVLFALLQGGPPFVQGMAQQLRALGPRAHIIITGFPPNEKGQYGSVPAPQLYAAVQTLLGAGHSELQTDCVAAFAALRARPEQFLLVTGSFFLLNYIRPLLKNAQQPTDL